MKIERSSLFTNHNLLDKEKRNLLILELIRKRGVVSRSEIVKTTGINVVSVSNYINNFIEKKLVLEKGFDVSTGGRKPELVELNLGANFVVGVDIGKNQLRAVSSDLALSVKERRHSARPNNREIPEAVVSLVEEIIDASGMKKSDVRAVGIGICGTEFIKIADAIKKKMGIDVFVGPSAVCAAFAEKKKNQKSDAGRLLYSYSDLGEGVVVEGDTFLSASEDARMLDGKLRYLRPWDDCLGIVASARREVSRGVGTKIVSLVDGDVEKITEKIVLEAAAAGDDVALNIAQTVGINLGLRLAYLINLFDPEVVVIGQDMQSGGPNDVIFVPMKKMVERLAFRDKVRKLKITASALDEDVVGVGAASLAVRETFIKA